MSDSLDELLNGARDTRAADQSVRAALDELHAEHARAARPRRRGRLVPAVSIGIVLGLLGGGAVAATQWGAWTYVPDADLTIARDWTDVEGNSLGSCESRLAGVSLTDEQRAAVRSLLSEADVDARGPDTEYVAGAMVSTGQPERLGQLIEGARVEDYDLSHTGPLWSEEWLSDARILQDGLTQGIFVEISDEVNDRWPELDGMSANVETQCTTDPAWLRTR